MKRFGAMLGCALVLLASLAFAVGPTSTVQTYDLGRYQSIAFNAGTAATATSTGPIFLLANYATAGILQLTWAGITGSPSGCTLTVDAQPILLGSTTPAGTAISTLSVAPANGTQFIPISPTVTAADQLYFIYACTTYPTTGTMNATFASSGVTSSQALNPCESPNFQLQTVSVATAGTTAVQLIPAVAGDYVFICGGYAVGVSGTNPTFSLEYGTGTNCATSPTVFMAAIPTTAGVQYVLPRGTFVVPAGKAVCYLDGGTTPIQSIAIGYVQVQ